MVAVQILDPREAGHADMDVLADLLAHLPGVHRLTDEVSPAPSRTLSGSVTPPSLAAVIEFAADDLKDVGPTVLFATPADVFAGCQAGSRPVNLTGN